MSPPGSESTPPGRSWRRTWLLPLLAIAGRRLAVYLALYPLHLALAGLTLAFIAVKAGTGDSDWIFWISYGWIALQVLVPPRLFVPSALALAFVALQATDGDRDAVFWVCFAWLCLMMLGGGIAIRLTRARRKRARGRAQAETGSHFENVFARVFGQGFEGMFGQSEPFGRSAGEPSTGGSRDRVPSNGSETIEGTAREVNPDLVDELERLAALHESGALTDEEYAAAKRRLLT